MKEKCCKNCFYFVNKCDRDPNGYMNIRYHCNLHDVKVTDPAYQFCEKWISTKIKKRIDNLEKLGL